MKLVHWQGTNHGVRNSTKPKLSLSLATTFSLCSSFNRHAAHLNSSCDTAHPALAFNIVISGLHILAAEKTRLVCYAKVLGYTVCQENVATCTSAHMQDCSLLKHSHSALQRGSTELPSHGWQEVKGMVHNRGAKSYLNPNFFTSISVMEGRRKNRDLKWEACECSVFWSFWLKPQRIKCKGKTMQKSLWRCVVLLIAWALLSEKQQHPKSHAVI